jgi:hypothetical protein
MNVGVFRGGCLTGPKHSGVEQHGFFSYLVKTAATGGRYIVYGYKGKQVRDTIHSHDVVRAIEAYAADPRPGEVYNLGGGRDFRSAVDRVKHAREQFLAVGRRWDTDISEPCDFGGTSWQGNLRSLVMQRGVQRTPEWIDYFVFTRGLYGSGVPPFVIGRVHWDHWLVWKIQTTESIPVVDLSAAVMAVHQNHDYSYHPQGKAGVWHGYEAGQNERLAGGWRHMRTIADATEILCAAGLRPNRGRHWAAATRYATQIARVARFDVWNRVLFFALGVTRPLRRWLGLRTELLAKWQRNA